MELVVTNKKMQSFTILYDRCDHDIISRYKWYVGIDGYARTVEKYPKMMHRVILEVVDSQIHVDHKNHIKLDNRRLNIRVCTRGQNMANRRAGGNSKYLGVSYQSYVMKGKVYCYIIATISANGRKKTLGRYKSEKEAAYAYDTAAKIYHGEFANLNFKQSA